MSQSIFLRAPALCRGHGKCGRVQESDCSGEDSGYSHEHGIADNDTFKNHPSWVARAVPGSYYWLHAVMVPQNSSTSTHSNLQYKELPVTNLILTIAYLKINSKAKKTTCDPWIPQLRLRKTFGPYQSRTSVPKDRLRRKIEKVSLNALSFILKSCIKMTCLSSINLINSLIV